MKHSIEKPSIDDIKHYGVIGMKWGIRRYQPYPDGKYGKYLGELQRSINKAERKYNRTYTKATKAEHKTYKKLNKVLKSTTPKDKAIAQTRKATKRLARLKKREMKQFKNLNKLKDQYIRIENFDVLLADARSQIANGKAIVNDAFDEKK